MFARGTEGFFRNQNMEPIKNMDHLKELIRTIPNFPKPGIEFRDLTTLFLHPQGFQQAVDAICSPYLNQGVDMVVGVESRGFILGAPVALGLKAGFVPVRKPGKLPGATLGVEYTLEYGADRLEMHRDALQPGMRVLMVDDLLATGGTMEAACHLVEQVGCQITGCAFLVELVDLQGRKRINGHAIHSLVEFQGE